MACAREPGIVGDEGGDALPLRRHDQGLGEAGVQRDAGRGCDQNGRDLGGRQRRHQPVEGSLANLEAVMGQLYLAILLARLVTLHGDTRRR